MLGWCTTLPGSLGKKKQNELPHAKYLSVACMGYRKMTPIKYRQYIVYKNNVLIVFFCEGADGEGERES